MSDASTTTGEQPSGTAPRGTPLAASRSEGVAQALLVACALSVATALLFTRSLTSDFIDFDDNLYVFDNPNINRGFSWQTWSWLPTAVVGGNWHPVTIASHMLDVQLYGLNPWGHHLTSVLIHALSTGLVCYVLWKLTGDLWPSAAAGALFGVHPLRVESVSWIAERKDVLCVFFFLLALLAFANFVQRRRWYDYTLLVVATVLGLMSKSMIVTLPCVLLLLDAWPLRRYAVCQLPVGDPRRISHGARLLQLGGEKILLFALVFIVCGITIGAQQSQGALRSLTVMPMRVINGLLSYRDYLRQVFWPTGLAVYHPHLGTSLNTSTSLVIGVAFLLFTWYFVQSYARRPYLLIGWLWFLGMLIPVIGIVQVGGQARADRFLYLPSIGLSIMVCWLVYDWARAHGMLPAATLGVLVVVATLSALTWREQQYWANTFAVGSRALETTRGNFVAQDLVGLALLDAGEPQAALDHFAAALEISPTYRMAAFHRGLALRELQQTNDALAAFDAVQLMDGADVETAALHGEMLLGAGRRDEARAEFEEVLRFDPGNDQAIALLAEMAAADGKTPVALEMLRKAHQRDPSRPLVAAKLAWLLATHPEASVRNADEALAAVTAALAIPVKDDLPLRRAEAAAHAERGEFDRATAIASAAQERLVELAGSSPRRAAQVSALKRELEAYQSRKPWREDPRDTESAPESTHRPRLREAHVDRVVTWPAAVPMNSSVFPRTLSTPSCPFTLSCMFAPT